MLDFHDYVCLGASGGKECMVMMDKFKRLFNKAKWLKKAGILTLVLTMLLTMFNNGVLIKADDNVNANINFTSQIVEQINGSYVSISDVQSGKSFF